MSRSRSRGMDLAWVLLVVACTVMGAVSGVRAYQEAQGGMIPGVYVVDHNPAVINLGTSYGDIARVTTSADDVKVGDWFAIDAVVKIKKGDVGGITYVRVISTPEFSSATLDGIADAYGVAGFGSTLWQRVEQGANTTVVLHLSGWYKCTATHPLNGVQLDLIGRSFGSDATVAIDSGYIRLARFIS